MSIPSRSGVKQHLSANPPDNDDPLTHKEEAVLASLQCNADSLHAALLEFEEDSLHESYELENGLNESGIQPITLSSVAPTLIPRHDELPSVAKVTHSAFSLTSIPRHDLKQVSASVTASPVLALKPWISFQFVLLGVILLSAPSGIAVSLADDFWKFTKSTCTGSSPCCFARSCR